MIVANVCIGLLGSLVFVLGFCVSMVRGKHKMIIGCPQDPESSLYKMIRVHANTAEYVPALMVMIYILSRNPVSTWLGWAFIIVTVCRFVYVIGMFASKSLEQQNPIRFISTLGTYVIGFVMAVEIIRQSVGV